jgi:hypothetical protein
MRHLDHYLLAIAAIGGTGWFVLRGELARRRGSNAEEPTVTEAPPTPSQAGARSGDAVIAAALLSVGAGVVHAFVIQEHFEETALFGGFFLVLALLQVAWAVGLRLAPSRKLLAAGAIGSLLVALLWVASRTTGLPVGPERWEAEPVGLSDSISTAFELGAAGLAFVALRSRSALSFVRPMLSRALPAVTTGLVIGLTYVALAGGGHH